jgi:hypothetical protein
MPRPCVVKDREPVGQGWCSTNETTAAMERGGNPIAAFSDAHDKKARYQEFPPMGDVPHWICKRSRDGRHDFALWIAGSPRSAPFTLSADIYKGHAAQARSSSRRGGIK